MKRSILLVCTGVGLAPVAPALAEGFGIGFGTPLEERIGGDYGPEYYSRLQAERPQSSPVRPSVRCHVRWVETRGGLKRVRRCS
jgi:hypothetical protein